MRDDKVAAVIPSVGRPLTLHETLLSVLRQHHLPRQIIVSYPRSVTCCRKRAPCQACSVIQCGLGSSRQRNGAIDALAPAIGLVAFLDDDVELRDAISSASCVCSRSSRDIPRARSIEIVAGTDAAASRQTREIGPDLSMAAI